MASKITIEGSPSDILGKLMQADVPRKVIDRLTKKAILGPEKEAHTWKCSRMQVACPTSGDPNAPVKYGYSVTCTVTYDDGSTDTIEEDYGC
jgi:hypothetical protein